jgi:hypothetical protein
VESAKHKPKAIRKMFLGCVKFKPFIFCPLIFGDKKENNG